MRHGGGNTVWVEFVIELGDGEAGGKGDGEPFGGHGSRKDI